MNVMGFFKCGRRPVSRVSGRTVQGGCALTRAVVSVAVVVGLAIGGAAETVDATKVASTDPRLKFIHHGDATCLQFRAARQALANLVFGADFVASSPDQQATFFKELQPIASAYTGALAELEAPKDARALLDAAVIDSYEALLLLVEANYVYGQPGQPGFAYVTDRIREHYDNESSMNRRLRRYGFTACGAPERVSW
ncbi:MAG: hypothetical protein ACRDY6_04025 [Acidimicrobiia bacterium]